MIVERSNGEDNRYAASFFRSVVEGAAFKKWWLCLRFEVHGYVRCVRLCLFSAEKVQEQYKSMNPYSLYFMDIYTVANERRIQSLPFCHFGK
jgi:hypothetical protein